jgi:hypothetical protein
LNEKRLKPEAKSENNVVRLLFQQNGKSFRINEKKDYILLMTEYKKIRQIDLSKALCVRRT